MDQQLVDFINENEELIEDNKWEELYKRANKKFTGRGFGATTVGELTKIFLDADIRPEEFLNNLPSYFLAGSKIDKFIIPSNINIIGSFAFSRCRKLRDIEIPSSINLIEWDAFAGSGLERINIPNTAKLGDSGIFLNCLNLSEVILEDGIAEIPSMTFNGCKKLMQVIIPKSITHIGYEAFANCGKNLTIKFAGTTREWRTLSKGSFSRTSYVAHCTDGDIRK